ncbi:MAG: FtsX-like permease family protein [Bacillota bacterium]|jgi:putative ABC transport system permease protein
MTLSRLVLANIGRSGRKYWAFLFSSVFSVLVFYLFASFAMHPDVTGGYIAQRASILRGVAVCQGIIVVFSFFFLWYSSSNFLRARKKELGLLTLMGATRRELGRMLVGEHAAIGAISVSLGAGFGTILFRYLLVGMARLMHVSSPVRFYVVVPALTLTAVTFMALFLVIGLFAAISLNPRKVVGLLRAHQKPKALPGFSIWAAGLSVVLIAGGYFVAWGVDGRNLVAAMFPVTAVVSLGTYLLFTQSTVGILRVLQQRPEFAYRGTNLLTTGDLVFRMKDNARVLASVAILSAGVMTVMGTVYTASATLVEDYGAVYPHAVTFAVKGQESAEQLSDLARGIFQDEGAEVLEEVAFAGVLADEALVISESQFNVWASPQGYRPVSVDPGQGIALGPRTYGLPPRDVSLSADGVQFDLEIRGAEFPFPRTNWLYSVQVVYVVDDGLHSQIEPQADSAHKVAFLSYELLDWQEAVPAGQKLEEALVDQGLVDMSSRLSVYAERVQLTALTAFIALFITALFFIASGSVLYFRVFSEADEDREKYAMMRKIGVTSREVKQVIIRQVAVLFFVPFLVGATHCGFALKALSNVLHLGPWTSVIVWKYGLMAGGLFFTLHIGYFGFACHGYMSEVVAKPRA